MSDATTMPSTTYSITPAGALELHRLIREFCTIMCRWLVAAGDPLAAAPYFVIARRPLADAIELFGLFVEPEIVRDLIDEAVHPGGGV